VIGILSGIFGVSGGVFAVPLLGLLHFDEHLAQGTSLVIQLPLCIVGLWQYARRGPGVRPDRLGGRHAPIDRGQNCALLGRHQHINIYEYMQGSIKTQDLRRTATSESDSLERASQYGKPSKASRWR
jgi:hypothetical protein